MTQETTSCDSLHELRPIVLPALPERPLVSVLVANYNYEKYLGQALDSLLAQTYEKWEAIVCDDGSTDNSRELIGRYAVSDPRIRYVFQGNGGVAKALNTAFAEARGSVICLLDADDLYEPGKIAEVVSSFRANPQAGYVAHRLVMMDSDGRKFGAAAPMTLEVGWLGQKVAAKGAWVKTAWGSAISLRSEVAHRLFPLPPQLRSLTDLYLILSAAVLTELAAIDKVLALYRVHSRNTTGTWNWSYSAERDLKPYYAVVNAHLGFLAANLSPEVTRLQVPHDYELFRQALLRARVRSGSIPQEFYDGTLAELVSGFRVVDKLLWKLLAGMPRRLAQLVLFLKLGHYPAKRYLRPLYSLLD